MKGRKRKEYRTVFMYHKACFDKELNSLAGSGWLVLKMGANDWGYWALMTREFDY